MKIIPCFITCVLFLPGTILRAAPGTTSESAARTAAAASAAASQPPPSATVAPHSLVNFVATKEQADHIGTLLKNKQATTDYLAAIFERNPINTDYRVRAGVEVIAVQPAEKSALGFVHLGHVYVTGEKSFYLQWDGLGASTLHYYGPFYGTPETVLGLASPDLRSDATAAPAFGPVIEGVIGFGGTNACFDLDSGQPVAVPELEQENVQKLRQAGVDLSHSPIQNDLNALMALDLRLVPTAADLPTKDNYAKPTPSKMAEQEPPPKGNWDFCPAAAVGEEIAVAEANADKARVGSSSPLVPGLYFFSTGKNLGLLQILGPNRPSTNTIDGVKFRYKLVQNTTTFGPVMERGIHGASMPPSYLDLDTGNAVAQKPPGDVGASLLSGNSRARFAMDMKVKEVPSEKWDCSSDEVVRDLLPVQPEKSVGIAGSGKPGTFFFQTREGSMGVLQVLPEAGDSPAVRIRYKLVQNRTNN